MRTVGRLSIEGQLILVTMAASVVSVAVASALFVAYDLRSYDQAMKDDLHVVAEGIALHSTPALEFESVESAREILGALRADPHIEMAVLYDRNGNSVDYRRPGLEGGPAPPLSGKEGAYFEDGTLRIRRFVRREGQLLGAIVIQSDTAERRERVLGHARVVAVAALAALVAALLVTAQLLKVLAQADPTPGRRPLETVGAKGPLDDGRALAIVLAALLAGCAGRCGARGGLPPDKPPTVKGPDGQVYHLVDKGPYKAYYDRWGRLQRIEYDSNGDGRPDHVARHDGRRHPYQLDVDVDFDGRPDRWERYDAEGRLEKIGAASGPERAPDLWVVPAADGETARREHDADGDGVPERIEILAGGLVTEVHVDADRDGRVDRWQKWDAGRLAGEDLDTDGDGRADRRLRYDAQGKVLSVEPAPAR